MRPDRALRRLSVEVVVPWRGGCPHRARALAWVQASYRVAHPDWPVRVTEAPAGAWVKAHAVTAATTGLAPDDIAIVADADVWTPGLAEAVQAVQNGAAWAVPHRGVFRLTQPATNIVLQGAPPRRDLELCERAYTGIPGGGIIVLPAGTLERVPLDRRFEGWGGEDEAWGLALTCLAGHPWRGKAPLYHLWHPPQPRLSRKIGSVENERLYRRYRAARTKPGLMQALVAEGQACRSLTS